MKKIAFILLLMAALTANGQKGSKVSAPERPYGMWGHGPDISAEIVRGMPFIKGWNFTFAWKNIEPEKGAFNWRFFDDQLTIAAKSNLDIGFMIWVGQNSPEWIYTKDGVPKVETDDNKHDVPYYPYYFSPAYKAAYFTLLKEVVAHVSSLPPLVRNKVLFWMSAEGTTGDETPYKGLPKNNQYDISEAQWFDFKKEAWSYMYNAGKALSPRLNILINQANDGRYLDWLLTNCPEAWFKAGSLAHTYQFNRELDYEQRLKKVVRPDNNGDANRFRSESEEVQQLGWYAQSPRQNSFMIAASALHIGLDIMNIRKNALEEANGDFSFQFFNRYAGQRDPAKATGAFCLLRDVLDVTDTARFPVAQYGAVSKGQGLKNVAQRTDEGYPMRLQLKNVSEARIQNIVQAFRSRGAQAGPSPEVEAAIYAADAQLPARWRRANIRPDLQDKYNVDIGINLVPGNYSRFLTQYKPNETSKGYWRVGPADQPYGRYARGFDHAAGMNEMWFALDPSFFTANAVPHGLKISIAYLDKGKGEWCFNYANAKGRLESFRVQCKGSNRWVVKEVELKDAFTDGRLPNQADFSLQYLAGDDTLFSVIEIGRL